MNHVADRKGGKHDLGDGLVRGLQSRPRRRFQVFQRVFREQVDAVREGTNHHDGPHPKMINKQYNMIYKSKSVINFMKILKSKCESLLTMW